MRKQNPKSYESYYGYGLLINIHEQAFTIGELPSPHNLIIIQESDICHWKVTKHVRAI